MIEEVAREVFSHLCHQEPARAWQFGGVALPLCARCTGVYAGAALAAMTLPWAKFEPGRGVLWLHGAAMLQMLLFGLGSFEQAAWVRTLSGSVFAAGMVYFLWLPVRGAAKRRGLRTSDLGPREERGACGAQMVVHPHPCPSPIGRGDSYRRGGPRTETVDGVFGAPSPRAPSAREQESRGTGEQVGTPSPLPLSQRERGFGRGDRGGQTTRYLIAAGGAIVLLQGMVRVDRGAVGGVVTVLALMGVVVIAALAVGDVAAIAVARGGGARA